MYTLQILSDNIDDLHEFDLIEVVLVVLDEVGVEVELDDGPDSGRKHKLEDGICELVPESE